MGCCLRGPHCGGGWLWQSIRSWGPYLISGRPEGQREQGWTTPDQPFLPWGPGGPLQGQHLRHPRTLRFLSAGGPRGLVRDTLSCNCPHVATYPSRQGHVGRRQEILSGYFPISESWGHVTSPDRKCSRPHWPPAFLSPSLPAASCLPASLPALRPSSLLPTPNT